MQHINNILSVLTLITNQSNKDKECLNFSNIPEAIWAQDNVDVLASMDTWTSDIIRRSPSSRESTTGRIFEHMRRLRIMYGGLQYKDLLHISKLAHATKGLWSYNIIALLERRLDIVLWRAFWSKSPKQSRSIIKKGHILVNGKTCRKSSYILSPGDLVSMQTGVQHFYQQRLLDTWSRDSKARVDKKYIDVSISDKNISVVDIITQALNHGSLVNTIKSEQCSLGFVKYSTPTLSGNKSNTNTQLPTLNVLKSIYKFSNNEKLITQIWSNVYNEINLNRVTENNSIYAYIPLNIEMNYKTISLIYLYTPQRVIWTSLIDMELLQNHLV